MFYLKTNKRNNNQNPIFVSKYRLKVQFIRQKTIFSYFFLKYTGGGAFFFRKNMFSRIFSIIFFQDAFCQSYFVNFICAVVNAGGAFVSVPKSE